MRCAFVGNSIPLPSGTTPSCTSSSGSKLRRAVIKHDAHRAFRCVRAHVDDTSCKAVVCHARHRDEKLPVEIAPVALRLKEGSFIRRSHAQSDASRKEKRGENVRSVASVHANVHGSTSRARYIQACSRADSSSKRSAPVRLPYRRARASHWRTRGISPRTGVRRRIRPSGFWPARRIGSAPMAGIEFRLRRDLRPIGAIQAI